MKGLVVERNLVKEKVLCSLFGVSDKMIDSAAGLEASVANHKKPAISTPPQVIAKSRQVIATTFQLFGQAGGNGCRWKVLGGVCQPKPMMNLKFGNLELFFAVRNFYLSASYINRTCRIYLGEGFLKRIQDHLSYCNKTSAKTNSHLLCSHTILLRLFYFNKLT
ncbi:MAG: hypothetical protein K9I74_05375 [Bacteroidales bacterium]|nr:hypothetical protein [Bacteroidales bacterium]